MIGGLINQLGVQLPDAESLDQGIVQVIPYVARFSEDLYEMQFYLNRRWREVRDDPNFHEVILHVFKTDGEYWRILNGDISKGKWELPPTGGIAIDFGGRHELYDRVFLNGSFFILRKHGNRHPGGDRYFFVLASEGIAASSEWPEIIDRLFELYRSNISYLVMVILFIAVVAIIVFFSLI